jgi:hypothetical protein
MATATVFVRFVAMTRSVGSLDCSLRQALIRGPVAGFMCGRELRNPRAGAAAGHGSLFTSSHYGETTLGRLVCKFGLALWALKKGMVLLAGPFFHYHGVAIGVGAGDANWLVP